MVLLARRNGKMQASEEGKKGLDNVILSAESPEQSQKIFPEQWSLQGGLQGQVAVLARLPSAGCQELLGRVSSLQSSAAFLQGCMHWECKRSGQEKSEHRARNCNGYRKSESDG